MSPFRANCRRRSASFAGSYECYKNWCLEPESKDVSMPKARTFHRIRYLSDAKETEHPMHDLNTKYSHGFYLPLDTPSEVPFLNQSDHPTVSYISSISSKNSFDTTIESNKLQHHLRRNNHSPRIDTMQNAGSLSNSKLLMLYIAQVAIGGQSNMSNYTQSSRQPWNLSPFSISPYFSYRGVNDTIFQLYNPMLSTSIMPMHHFARPTTQLTGHGINATSFELGCEYCVEGFTCGISSNKNNYCYHHYPNQHTATGTYKNDTANAYCDHFTDNSLIHFYREMKDSNTPGKQHRPGESTYALLSPGLKSVHLFSDAMTKQYDHGYTPGLISLLMKSKYRSNDVSRLEGVSTTASCSSQQKANSCQSSFKSKNSKSNDSFLFGTIEYLRTILSLFRPSTLDLDNDNYYYMDKQFMERRIQAHASNVISPVSF